MNNHTSFLSADGPLAGRLDGFEVRPQQIEMASAVASALADKATLLVEAGTGVGKSLGYLIPAVERATRFSETIVICTNTIALQEQLIEKDIPLLQSVYPQSFKACLVKGRGNYVSIRRLQLATERQRGVVRNEADRIVLQQLEDWAIETTDGSRSSLPVRPPHHIWEAVQSDKGNCMGSRCPNYDSCFYQTARRGMEGANILICNHALFFSDLALKVSGKGFLPDYHHVILDEAHTIEEVVSSHFGLSISESTVHHLLRSLWSGSSKHGLLGSIKGSSTDRAVEEAISMVELCKTAANDFFHRLWEHRQNAKEDRVRAPIEGADALPTRMRELTALLTQIKGGAESEADQFEIAAFLQRAEGVAETASALLAQSTPGCVYWIDSKRGDSIDPPIGKDELFPDEAPTRRGGHPPVSMHAAVVDVAPVLREHLFSRHRGCILTSATLSLGAGDFAHTASRLGCDEPRTLQLGSPFDFRRQLRLIIDTGMPDKAGDRMNAMAAQRIIRHVRETDGGAFVLFTSYTMLNAVAGLCAEAFANDERPMIVHGQDGERSAMLTAFRSDPRSVLFGTSSFWQGIDVRGDGLRNVIITRLPFEVPDRPLVQARGELITELKQNPFLVDSLPRAVIRFKQGVGRLIRSREDMGRVVVLDPRIVTHRYGQAFLAALPEGVEAEMDGLPEVEESIDW
ncbi:MAG: helicase [Planctomycetota bacterium]|nr:helicase [Planctomycetota bacterium]